MSNNPLTSRATDNAIHSMNQPLAQLSGASGSLLMIVKREQELHSLANNNPPLSQDVINEVLAPPSVVTIPSSAFPDVKHGEDSRSPDLPEPAVNESSITSHVTGNITGEVVSASGIGRENVCNVLPQLKSEPNSLEIISFSLNVTELEKLKKQNLELLKRDAQITGELSEEKKKVIEYMEKLDQSDKVNDDLRQKLRACRTQLTRTINEANQRLIDRENQLQAEITALKADKNEQENVLILKLQHSQGASGVNSQESEEDAEDCRGVHLEDVETQVDDQKCYQDSMTQTYDQNIADKLQAIVPLAGIEYNTEISPVCVDESEEVVRRRQAEDRLHLTGSEDSQQASGDPSHNNNLSVTNIVGDRASNEEVVADRDDLESELIENFRFGNYGELKSEQEDGSSDEMNAGLSDADDLLPDIDGDQTIQDSVSVCHEKRNDSQSQLPEATKTVIGHGIDALRRVFAVKRPGSLHNKLNCMQCTGKFGNAGALTRHIRCIHGQKNLQTTVKPSRSSDPLQQTPTPHERSEHLRIRRTTSDQYQQSYQRPHRCVECGMCFKQRAHLRDHKFRHAGIHPYGCKWCSRTFVAKSACKKHLMRSHDIPDTENFMDHMKYEDSKNFIVSGAGRFGTKRGRQTESCAKMSCVSPSMPILVADGLEDPQQGTSRDFESAVSCLGKKRKLSVVELSPKSKGTPTAKKSSAARNVECDPVIIELSDDDDSEV